MAIGERKHKQQMSEGEKIMKDLKVLAITIFLPLLIACKHKELCYNHPHYNDIRINWHWEKLDLDEQHPQERPSLMRVLIYDNNKPESLPIAERQFGGIELEKYSIINLPDGNYTLIAYSENTDWTTVIRKEENMTINELQLTTQGGDITKLWGIKAELLSRTENTQKNSSVYMARTLVEDINIENDQYNKERIIDIHAYPIRMSYHFTYEVSGIVNLRSEEVNNIKVGLDGLPGDVYLKNGKAGKNRYVITNEYGKINKDNILIGEIRSLAMNIDENEEKGKYEFIIYIPHSEGTKLKRFDVSDQIYKQMRNGDSHCIHLKIDADGMIIPKFNSGESGFKPEMENWREIHTLIEL